jgi:hypothetical protein
MTSAFVGCAAKVNHLLLAATKNWHTGNGGYNSSAHTPASVWARTDEPERQATAEENKASRTSRSTWTWNQASQAASREKKQPWRRAPVRKMKTKEKVAQVVEAERTRDPEQSGGGLQGEYAGGQKLMSNSGGRIKILPRGYHLWRERLGEKISEKSKS